MSTGIGVIVATRSTGSAASCAAVPTGSPSGPGVGCGPDWSPATGAGRSPPPGPSSRTWMRCYQLRDASAAAAVITAARDCPVPEIARLGRTLHTWRTEFLAHFAYTDVSNGPTEALNLKIKNTKRTARGFRNFGNYRLRLLLNHGRIQNNHQTSRIRTRRPSLVA